MAKVTIMLNSAVLVSSVKKEDIAKLQKYRPSALVLRDEEDNPVFAIGVTSGRGVVGRNGIEFAQDVDGFAAVEIPVPDIADKKAYVQDVCGVTILRLNQLEELIPDELEDLDSEVEAISECIEFAFPDSEEEEDEEEEE